MTPHIHKMILRGSYQKYCTKYLIPSTKSYLSFDDEGVCSDCNAYDSRSDVDCDSGKKELQELVQKYKNNDELSQDCIIPVSGGKDSTNQVISSKVFTDSDLDSTKTKEYDLSENTWVDILLKKT